MNLAQSIIQNHIYKDFPKEGVNFIDIFPLLSLSWGNLIQEEKPREKIIFLPESRGFLFYGLFPNHHIIPLRKKGKLPGTLQEISYKKEYGEDKLYFQTDSLYRIIEDLEPNSLIEICFFDDVLATGGTAKAFVDFFNNYNLNGYKFKVTTCKFFLEIESLNGRKLLEETGTKINSFITY